MKEIALTIGGYNIPSTVGSPTIASSYTLGDLISRFLEIAFPVIGIAMFIWAMWGAFQYVMAGANKEDLAKAKARITWAIIGFLFTVVSYALSTFIKQLFLG